MSTYHASSAFTEFWATRKVANLLHALRISHPRKPVKFTTVGPRTNSVANHESSVFAGNREIVIPNTHRFLQADVPNTASMQSTTQNKLKEV